jgi:uncharacterized protein
MARVALWGVVAAGICGCSVTKPVQDEVVRHLLEPVVAEAPSTAIEPRIAVARPNLPRYLDRMQMVTRDADGQIKTHDNHLWAESLNVNMARVLTSNLRRLTRSRNVQTIDSFVTADYSVLLEVRVHQFDPEPSGRLVLECDWRLQPVIGGDMDPTPFRTEVVVDPGGRAMDGRVTAMNEALGRLAREIARSL